MTLTIFSKGKEYFVKYDSADHGLISRYNWVIHSKGYAYTFSKGRGILMHRLLLGILDERHILCDHINHDRLDNRRINLRRCNRSENQRNVRPTGRSKYLGVRITSYTKKDGTITNRIRASIKTTRQVDLGAFLTEEDAAKAYDVAAKQYHGEFANLNFK